MIIIFLKRTFLFILLTIFTQVGGIIYIISHLVYRLFKWNKLEGYKEGLRRLAFHVVFYLLLVIFIVPPIASIFGRVPLPYFTEQHLGPRTIWTTLLNRHYVRPQLRELVLKSSAEIGEKYPGIRVNYYDANFPLPLALPLKIDKFMNFEKGFPLFPHLSHNDGKKLDLGFVYNDAETGELSNASPSAIGYGVSEEPLKGEVDIPSGCRFNGKWQYNFMNDYYPKGGRRNYNFNEKATSDLINLFRKNPKISTIFLEEHLENRLKLNSGKINNAGCKAVRHDDHFHIQIP